METGEKLPKFVLDDEDGNKFDSSSLKGKRYVIYFYPKDNTSGCTREAVSFSEKVSDFESIGVGIIGISKDSSASHRKFIDDKNLRFKLLSDPDHELMEKVGAWGTKVMYGKEATGTIRSTLIVGKDGTIEAVWKKVKVDGHADKVLEKAKELAEKE